MDFETRLSRMIETAGGELGNIRWGTMNGRVLTLGTMTDEHLANSRYYHQHMAEVVRVAPELRIDVEDCLFNKFLMEQEIDSRQSAGTWTIPAEDFRLH